MDNQYDDVFEVCKNAEWMKDFKKKPSEIFDKPAEPDKYEWQGFNWPENVHLIKFDKVSENDRFITKQSTILSLDGLKEILRVQIENMKTSTNVDYNRGLTNGLILALAIITDVSDPPFFKK